jgi:hypothetical protein
MISYQLCEFPLRFINSYLNVFHRNWRMELLCKAWGSVMVKSEYPGNDSRWCHWGFLPWLPTTEPCALGSIQPLKMSTTVFSWVKKAAGTYGWRPTTLVVPNVEKIWGLNLPGTPWATSAVAGWPLPFTVVITYITRKILLYLTVFINQQQGSNIFLKQQRFRVNKVV